MNGAPLPWLHGGPARLALPGWVGNDWIKWVRSIRLVREMDKGFYASTGYRFPVEACPPGGPVSPRGTAPLTENVVKSIIARPQNGAVLRAGTLEAAGVAFSGLTAIARVDVSLDDGKTWQQAALEGDDTPGAWKVWRHPFRALSPGRRTILARATDARGATQPDEPRWNPAGYLYTPVERVTCEVIL
jgi:DMSO/TMAO reductase YedYZ molybdopterin-dependent catalytic subunit